MTARGTPAGAGPVAGGRGRAAALFVLGALLAGCATYDERLEDTHAVFYDGRTELAVRQLEEALQTSLDEDGTDAGVLRLELAMACQAAGRYAEAVEHLKVADARLEVLDYTDDPLETIASFTFSPEARVYRASPPERVMVNTQNMLNQLLAGDPAGAEVEARRLVNLLVRADVDADVLHANRFAWGLAGLVLLAAHDVESAGDALARAGGSGLEVPRPLPDAELDPDAGTLLVVAQTGRVPIRREAVYVVPVIRRTVRVNVPALVRRPPAFQTVQLRVDGVDVGQVPVLFDLGAYTRARYEDEFPRLLAAALAQALPRAVVSEAIGQAAEAVAEGMAENAVQQADDQEAQAAALLASFAVEVLGGIVASIADWFIAEAQATDTRSWTLLPEQLRALRLDLPPGTHEVRLTLSGRAGTRVLEHLVEVRPGELSLVHEVTAVLGGDLPPDVVPTGVLGDHDVELALELIATSATLYDVLE